MNPTSEGNLDIPADVSEEFLRGAVTSVLSTWECFVDDLLTEAFNIVVHMACPDSSSEGSVSSIDSNGGMELKKLRKRWPNCQKVIQAAIKRRGARQNKPLEVVAFELIMEKKPHISLLMDHRQNVLRGVSPLLMGEGGIEEAFNNLFAIKATKSSRQLQPSLCDHMASLPSLLQYNYLLINKCEVNLSYQSVKIVNDILRLYYGTRCVISHGVATKTVSEGCLSDFPSVTELQDGLSSVKAAEEFRGLYERLKRDGKSHHLS